MQGRRSFIILPREAGKGDRALARWKGRRPHGWPRRRMPPPPHFVWSPSPALCAGAESHIVLATRSCARALLTTTTRKKLCFPSSKREAERRKAHAIHVRGSQTGARTGATRLLRGCAPFRGAPALRRSRLRHSPPATTPMAQPQNRVSRKRTAQVFCPLGPLVCG
jgi:hypothetical protein